MVAQAERRRNTRAALLDSARTVIAEKGVEGAGLEEIAARAGYTKGAIYGHFATKDDLVLAVLEGVSEELSVEVSTDRDGIEQTLETLFSFDSEAAQLFIEVLVFALRHEATRERLTESFRTGFALLADRLEGPRAHERAVALNGAVLGLVFLRLVMGPDVVNARTMSAALEGLVSRESFSRLVKSGGKAGARN